jgi:hypothetical protein
LVPFTINDDFLLSGDEDARLSLLEVDLSANCQPFPCTFTTKLFTFAESDTWSFRDVFGLRAVTRNQVGNILIESGTSLEKNDTINYHSSIPLTPTMDRIDFRANSRNHIWRFSTNSIDSDFAIREYAPLVRGTRAQR